MSSILSIQSLVGILLIIVGFIVASSFLSVALVSMFLLAWILLIVGVVLFALPFFRSRGTPRSLLFSLLGSMLFFAIGLLVILNPTLSLALFLLLASLAFIIVGVSKIAGAVFERDPGWIWQFFVGVIFFLFGIILWYSSRPSGVWYTGVFIGASIIVAGVYKVFSGMRRQYMPA